MCELVDNFVKEQAQLLAPVLAKDMAEDMAKDMAEDMAKNMTIELVKKIMPTLSEEEINRAYEEIQKDRALENEVKIA